MDDFLIRAALGGIGVMTIAGPLGCFIVWRRMAYFGDTLAHSALLGIVLGTAIGINPAIGVAATCVALALLFVFSQQQHRLAADTVLGILSHSALAIGMVALSFIATLRVDLVSYLFGDILAVTPGDLGWIYGGGLVALILLAVVWRDLLTVTVNEELAQAEGVPVMRTRLVFVLLIAVVIAIAMKIIGILLITSLLIIPAATARGFARTPESMAVMAVLIGIVAVIGGLAASLYVDTPSGPSVVVAALVLFVAGALLGTTRRAGAGR